MCAEAAQPIAGRRPSQPAARERAVSGMLGLFAAADMWVAIPVAVRSHAGLQEVPVSAAELPAELPGVDGLQQVPQSYPAWGSGVRVVESPPHTALVHLADSPARKPTAAPGAVGAWPARVHPLCAWVALLTPLAREFLPAYILLLCAA